MEKQKDYTKIIRALDILQLGSMMGVASIAVLYTIVSALLWLLHFHMPIAIAYCCLALYVYVGFITIFVGIPNVLLTFKQDNIDKAKQLKVRVDCECPTCDELSVEQQEYNDAMQEVEEFLNPLSKGE